MDILRLIRKRSRVFGLLSVVCIVLVFLSINHAGQISISKAPTTRGLRGEDLNTFISNAINGTVVIVPTNSGHLHWAKNLLCSLERHTTFDTSKIIFWTLDLAARDVLASGGYATYHDPSLFAVATDENHHGDSKAYKRMMKERPKFYFDVLSAGFDILMLDADTVFWQSPLSIMPDETEQVDVVYSTDAREFYQSHDAFLDERRRGPYIPPICNGIFWMKSSPKTIALWMQMLEVFHQPWYMLPFRKRGFGDDQRGMDVLLNDGRAQLVGPLPRGINPDGVPQSPASRSDLGLHVKLLDQTKVVNGHLLLNRNKQYSEQLSQLKRHGQDRIAAHFNWFTEAMSKEEGSKELGLNFLDKHGNCKASSR